MSKFPLGAHTRPLSSADRVRSGAAPAGSYDSFTRLESISDSIQRVQGQHRPRRPMNGLGQLIGRYRRCSVT